MKKIMALFSIAILLSAFTGCTDILNAVVPNTNNPKTTVPSLDTIQKNSIYVVYKAKDPNVQDLDTKMSSAMAIITKRLVEQGLSSATVFRQGSDQLRVELPGVESPDEVFGLIGTQGLLEFVDPEGNVIMTGEDIVSASQGVQNGMVVVNFQLNDAGTAVFADATTRLVGQPIRIRLDGVEISSPTVNTPITGGSAYIEGDFTVIEADRLAKQLKSGALPLQLEMVESGIMGN